MKHSRFTAVLSAFFTGMVGFLAGCINVEYVAKTDLSPLPDDAKVVVYYDKTQFPVPEKERILVGNITASASTSSYNLSQIKARVVEVARAHGSNAVLIISIDHRKSGEVRSDQAKNESAPSWTPIDNSSTDFQRESSQDFFMGVKDPDLPIYLITVKADLYQIPASAILKEKPLKKEPVSSTRQEPDIKINIRSNLDDKAPQPVKNPDGN